MFKSIYNPKVSMQERKEKAQLCREQLRREQANIAPMLPFEGKIVITDLGRHWCDNFDFYSHLKTQTYFAKQCLRLGGVCHLAISQGTITAIVSDAEPCTVTITIPPADRDHLAVMQQEIKKSHLSVVNFRRGRLPEALVKTLCTPRCGLIPSLQAITATCTCGRQGFCLHVLAALFGIGRLLDTAPQLVFFLRGIEAWDLYPTGRSVPRKGKQSGQAARPATPTRANSEAGSKTSGETESESAEVGQASAVLKPVAEDADARASGDNKTGLHMDGLDEDEWDEDERDKDEQDEDEQDEARVPDEIQLPRSRPRALHRPASDMYISGIFSGHDSDEDLGEAILNSNDSHLVEEMTDLSSLYDMDDDGDPHMDVVLEKMWHFLDLSAMFHFSVNIQKVFSSPKLQKKFDDRIARISHAEFLLHGGRARKWQGMEPLSEDNVRDIVTTGVAIGIYCVITELAEGRPVPMNLFANADPDTEPAVPQENFSAGENLDQADMNARHKLELFRDAQETFTDPDECMKIDDMYARVLDSPELTRKFFAIFARDYSAPLVSLVASARLAEMGCSPNDVHEDDVFAAGTAVVAPFVLARVLEEEMPTLGPAPSWQAVSRKNSPALETASERDKEKQGQHDDFASKTSPAESLETQAAKPQATKISAAPAMDQPAKASETTAKPQITKIIAVPAKEQPAKSETTARPQATKVKAESAQDQPAKASEAAAKPQAAQAKAESAQDQPAKASEAAAKPQAAQAKAEPAKEQPARADKTAEKTKTAQASGTAAGTRSTQASIPLPFDKDHPTGEGLRELFKLSGTSEEGFAWNIGVAMPTLNRWLKVEGSLSLRSASVLKICKYQTKVMKRLAKA